jgi:transcriptional regulator with XRE-family HTH domain
MSQKLKALGQELKVLRDSQGLSQHDVAKALNYQNAQFISNMERGLAFPPIKKLPILARILEIDPGDLFDQVSTAKLEIEYNKFMKALRGMRRAR